MKNKNPKDKAQQFKKEIERLKKLDKAALHNKKQKN